MNNVPMNRLLVTGAAGSFGLALRLRPAADAAASISRGIPFTQYPI